MDSVLSELIGSFEEKIKLVNLNTFILLFIEKIFFSYLYQLPHGADRTEHADYCMWSFNLTEDAKGKTQMVLKT